MRTRQRVYWIVTGGLMGFGLIGSLSIGFPFLLVGLAMLVVGCVIWRGRGVWLAVIAFGALPALILLFDIVTAPPPCPAGPITVQQGQSYTCVGHLEGYYPLAAIFGGIALLGIAWGLIRWLWTRQHAR